jgi:hypothetical protein
MKYRLCCEDRETGEVHRGPWNTKEVSRIASLIMRDMASFYRYWTEELDPLPPTNIPELLREIREDGT